MMITRCWYLALGVVFISCTQREYTGPVSESMEPVDVEIEAFRTPEQYFEDLPDYPFTAHYIQVSGNLRMHYLDENPAGKKTAVLIHGEPTWSYTYRYMIPVLVEAGYRVVVPDMIGFGKSDKPKRIEDHTYRRHINWMRTLLFDSLQLDQVNFYLQDMGGMVGLRLVASHPERVSSVVVSNSALPTGDQIPGEAFLKWQETLENMDPFLASTIVQWGCDSTLPEEVLAAYDAPFPNEAYQAAPRALPLLIPVTASDPETLYVREAWTKLKRFNKPFLAIYGKDSHLTRNWFHTFQKKIPGAAGQPHELIPDAGHFLQEDSHDYLALKMISFIANTK